MFDHVKFGVRDFAVSKAFYLKALEPIGVTVVIDWPPDGAELSQPAGNSSLCLYQTDEKRAPELLTTIDDITEAYPALLSAMTVSPANTLAAVSESPGIQRCPRRLIHCNGWN